MLRATDLARELNLSKGRISQLVAKGALTGCYDGEGVGRRFDLEKCVQALGRRLDAAQMLGNGAGTRRVLNRLGQEQAEGQAAEASSPATASKRKPDVLPAADLDRYELARAAKAEEDLRAMRLKNGRDEGLFVLASEVERQMGRVMAQELGEIDAFLKEAARKVADQMQVDFKLAKKILMDAWRGHRAERSGQLAQAVETAALSEPEKAEQI